MTTPSRSDKFRLLLKDMGERDLDKVVELEKSVRLLVHTYNLIGDIDEKLLHRVARASHELRMLYESK